jgi:hypothetical protein
MLNMFGMVDRRMTENLSWIPVHTTGQHHRPACRVRPAALDRGRPSARRPVPRSARRRGNTVTAGCST